MRASLTYLILAIALGTACGPKVKNQCPGTVARGCVNGEVCSFDRKRGCQVCRCRTHNQIDMGNDPDDMNPPIPVR